LLYYKSFFNKNINFNNFNVNKIKVLNLTKLNEQLFFCILIYIISYYQIIVSKGSIELTLNYNLTYLVIICHLLCLLLQRLVLQDNFFNWN